MGSPAPNSPSQHFSFNSNPSIPKTKFERQAGITPNIAQAEVMHDALERHNQKIGKLSLIQKLQEQDARSQYMLG
jgi:hypothetical protein